LIRTEKEKTMRQLIKTVVVALMTVCISLHILVSVSQAQVKEFKLGVLYCLTGANAAAGATAGYRGTMVAIDMINDRGGIGGQYKVVPVVADAQSDPDIAVREGQRLMTVENVPVVVGVFASGNAVPLAPVAEKKVVSVEPYDVKTKDLSSLIVKLKDAKPDAILHTGHFPDVVLFLRQARELGLKTKALVGHGAGYSNFLLLRRAVDPSMVLNVFNVDPTPAQIIDPKKLAPEQGELNKEFLERYKKMWDEGNPPSHATQGFGHTWVLLNNVAKMALAKYGGLDAESIRKAAAEIDIPQGATPCGYGVKVAPPEDKYGGQNVRSYPVVMQWTKGKLGITWPDSMKTAEPIIPMPEDSPYSTK
jgi:ABC-type branched-subunit amino acid transport system substrate-binding protein